ncbi:MAG: hypothetical protein M3R63_11520 [Actinomycetota bacterium]|nr:hypothetical protein [Actinomycetota bacterium]
MSGNPRRWAVSPVDHLLHVLIEVDGGQPDGVEVDGVQPAGVLVALCGHWMAAAAAAAGLTARGTACAECVAELPGVTVSLLPPRAAP